MHSMRLSFTQLKILSEISKLRASPSRFTECYTCYTVHGIESITAVDVLITGTVAFVAAFPQEGASVTFFLEPSFWFATHSTYFLLLHLPSSLLSKKERKLA